MKIIFIDDGYFSDLLKKCFELNTIKERINFPVIYIFKRNFIGQKDAKIFDRRRNNVRMPPSYKVFVENYKRQRLTRKV